MSITRLLTIALFACAATPALAAPQDFAFAVIGHAQGSTDGAALLQKSIAETDTDNLAFVVVNGVKSPTEACDDGLYAQRREIVSHAQNGVIMSLAASDWLNCNARGQKTSTTERLTQVREQFHTGEFSLGASKLPLLRQSLTAKFRSYAENTRWEVGNVLFATINLPAANNHFLLDGGRNNEFEDRLIANRNWLQHLFAFAALKKVGAIVFFADGNLFSTPPRRSFFRTQRDGFSEIRRSFSDFSGRFPGRVLMVHGDVASGKAPPRILWTGNVGVVGVGERWLKVVVDDHLPQLFAVADADGERR
ncbi:hypothetical protein [Herbaspirillum sp. YR522]|uniref:hypothetical protein n=1 Tax=Herbaspirillum sp. YR522 TaxID=1144342 RepID=UPI00026F53BC|nr:hypothetical protein [Herbaspirillum sp. YR522]EJN03823.1 hypothetical protein PMI40_02500 [Herbaspirillum sp. YR522]